MVVRTAVGTFDRDPPVAVRGSVMIFPPTPQYYYKMSETPDDDRLDELREKKMEQLKEQEQGGEAAEAQREAAEAQRKAILRQYLTDGARKRLNSVKMSKPDFGEKVERQIVAIAQSGRVQGKIDEDQMRELLKELKPDETEYNIRRR